MGLSSKLKALRYRRRRARAQAAMKADRALLDQIVGEWADEFVDTHERYKDERDRYA